VNNGKVIVDSADKKHIENVIASGLVVNGIDKIICYREIFLIISSGQGVEPTLSFLFSLSPEGRGFG